jgi:MFS family permease
MTRSPLPPGVPLLRDERFRLFAAAKLLQQSAQNALLYGLFIIVVREQDSALATSAFVIAMTAPSVLLSIPGAVLAESMPRKLALLLALAARAAIAWAFIGADPSIGLAVGLALSVSAVQQVFGPAESSALRSIVPDEKLGQGAALTNAITLLSQALGAGLLAPLTIKTGSEDHLFVLVFALLLASAVVYLAIPRLTPSRAVPRERAGLLASLPVGWRTIRSKTETTQIAMLSVTMDATLGALIVVVPLFVTDVLNTSAENAVYVFAPAAIGLAFGLLIAPPLLALLPPRPIVLFGFLLTVGVMFALPFVHDVARELDERTFLPLSWVQDWLNVRREIAATSLLLVVGGLGVSLVEVGTRTALYRAAPAHAVGQVLSTKATLGALASIVPTLTVGLLLDVLSPESESVLLVLAVAATLLATASWLRAAPDPRFAGAGARA